MNSEEMSKLQMSRSQGAAMILSRQLASQIARDISRIADDYRRGATGEEIVKKHRIDIRYCKGSESIALSSVYFALAELMPEGERHRLAYEHTVDAAMPVIRKQQDDGTGIYGFTSKQHSEAGRKGGSKSGRIVYEQKLGIHGLSHEERSKIGKKAGKIGGSSARRMRKGIHSLTPEQRREISRKAVAARGYAPFSDEEKTYFLELCADPEFQYGSGPNKGRPEHPRIAKGLEQRFGIDRSGSDLASMKCRLERRKGA
ncbi:MAG: hypothetical protein HYW25_05905 [Candidatus Aenigmarchaeota archaeon]|nr:hypothetical protein [Candidatus Aenigmarchaeota archaeon]